MGVCFKGHDEIAKYLIDNGADVNLQSANGATALFYAINFSQHNMVKLLIGNGADLTMTDAKGNTAYEQAKRQGNMEIMAMLQ
ncbi:MAG: ankyrin repeat domain-containing protein, partial [Fulvivirga sp.]